MTYELLIQTREAGLFEYDLSWDRAVGLMDQIQNIGHYTYVIDSPGSRKTVRVPWHEIIKMTIRPQ